MKSSLKILSALAIAGLALAANAQKHLQLTGPGQLVKPVAAARAHVVRTAANKYSVQLVGGWHQFDLQRPAASTTIAFDGCEFTFDSDPNNTSPADGLYGRDCSTLGLGLGFGSRWFFGTTYVQGGRLDDMKLTPGAAGKRADRLMFAWYNAAGTTNNATFVGLMENFPTGAGGNGLDPNTEPLLDGNTGVIIQFGTLGAGGYYFSDVDLTTGGLSMELPHDQDGAYLIAHGDFDGTNLNVGMCQNMLWGPGQPNNPSGPGNGLIWDDDTPLDAAFTDPDELFDYTFGICPDPIGGMLSLLYTAGSTSETLAPTSGAVTIGKDTSGNVGNTGAVDGVSWRICKFVVTSATSPIVRVRFDYTTTKTAPTAIDWAVTAKMVHSGTFKIQLLLTKDPNNPNNNTGYDVILPQTTINTTMATYTGSAVNTPLSQYVGTGGQMHGRVEIYRNFSAVAAPCVEIDAALLKVTG